MNGLPDVGGLLNQAENSLSSLASAGLPAGAASQLQAAISSIGGSIGAVKLPTIASNTNNRTTITTSVKDVLGDDKIPAPQYTGKPPASKELVKQDADVDKLKEEYKTARKEYEKYVKEVWKPLEKEKNELLKTTQKGDPKREDWNTRSRPVVAELHRLSIKEKSLGTAYYQRASELAAEDAARTRAEYAP
jgi:hypothetical protein